MPKIIEIDVWHPFGKNMKQSNSTNVNLNHALMTEIIQTNQNIMC